MVKRGRKIIWQVIEKPKGKVVSEFFFEENLALFTQTIKENERKEKLRRINKSPTKDKNLKKRFGYNLVYPSVYKVVKDTSNFIWIQKKVQKGHLNIIAYEISDNISDKNFNTKINDIMKQNKYTINSTIEVIENLLSTENIL